MCDILIKIIMIRYVLVLHPILDFKINHGRGGSSCFLNQNDEMRGVDAYVFLIKITK